MALGLPGTLGAVGDGVAHPVQDQLHIVGLEHGSVVGELGSMSPAGIVEAGLDVDDEAHGAAHDTDESDDPMTVGRRPVGDRHEVDDLADPALAHEPGDQDGGVREVQLPGHVVDARWSEPEVPTAVGVEERREHARRIESWAAEPVDRAVGVDERGRLEVADQSVVADVWVVSHGGVPFREYERRRVGAVTWLPRPTSRRAGGTAQPAFRSRPCRSGRRARPWARRGAARRSSPRSRW